ncbi:MAG TPA: hypothetical protein VK997_12300 [Deferrisomatales bacterium]|nr:hypothetical protein [Deferrisomatales bacterium]
MATANDLLLRLRCHAPHLARRLDGIRGMGVRGGVVTVRTSEDGWTARQLRQLGPELEREAGRVWGEAMRLEIEACPPARDALPLPVASTKYWNHVVFVAATPRGVSALAAPKPLYQDQWVPQAAAGTLPPRERLSLEDRVRFLRYPAAATAAPEDAMLAALPGLLDDLAELARDHRSYAQLVMAFPGDAVADRLEARLYGIKEWGTPRTPGPILHKYVGRVHYLPPDTPHLGLRLAAEV